VLPTSVYFYGLKVGDELLIDIEQGKTLVVRCVAVGEPNDKGLVRVFFELNGQPRSIQVPDRIHGATGANLTRAKADPQDKLQVGAPMPGVISTVNISIRRGKPDTSELIPPVQGVVKIKILSASEHAGAECCDHFQ